MRCALIKVREDAYQFVWSHHHLLMDGWCNAIILKEVLSFYEAFNKSQNLYLNTPRLYRDYIIWLQQQNISQAEAFWRQALQGFTAPTPLVVNMSVGDLSNQKQSYDQQYLQLSATSTAALQSLAQQHHLTLNTLVQGVWALLLSRYSGERDVVFGATVSGRPTSLSGVESMVGLFINTLPVRVQVSPAELLPWLQQLQAEQIEREVPKAYNTQINDVLLTALVQAFAQWTGVKRLRSMVSEARHSYPEENRSLMVNIEELAQESSGPAQSLQGKRCHLLEINGLVIAGQLRLDWTYSKNLYRRSTIESLAQSFEEALLQIIAYCQCPEAGGYTPSDFSLAQLDQEKLDEVLGMVEF